MSRFLFAMWEGGGTVPPEIAIARRLLLRNHAVHVIGDPTIEDAARQIGALKELITNQRYRERASAMASRMKAESSSDRAVDELERLASTTPG